ncbi:bifunctional alpha/beta hydrolase/class I SAM-dependent methyltransferase [Stieleria sp. JC731]|uniref:bifunctional alpha/beta hydrolase/class I SAM-dependent methyltransferase n=1 Tax=Pirellulaceae TaxID=2691357 RepID=UPI001E2FFC8F|nr:bifunctional alpha/beta hydrolase/class I SAM-dependent methyltransferase [Stieleria sp. JC731]MCC9600229.1 bifunctional alpha/beta hydrolase/class I SAM-dependent methyltransferase [Stieleria sp. JC731]
MTTITLRQNVSEQQPEERCESAPIAASALHRSRSIAEAPKSSCKERRSVEDSFVASDGQIIFYRYWRPASESQRSVLLFHRGHEHSERWQEFVETSELDDCWFFAWDARGHGRTQGARGAAESFARMVQDADEFACHLSTKFGLPISEMGVVGQSVGAVLAAAWIHDYARPVRAMVLATPALRIKLYVPLAIPGLRLLHKVRPQSFISSYVKPKMLTHDHDQARRYASDPLISPQIAVNVLLDLYDSSTRLMDDASAITTPTLMFVSDKDYVVRNDAQKQFFAGLSSSDKQLVELKGFYHSTFWERDRAQVIKQTSAFLKRQFVGPKIPASSQQLAIPSERKYRKLKESQSIASSAWYSLQRLMLNTAGRLSRGVRIGWKSGFDSGQSLDHVYRDKAEGISSVGRMIDRGYLDAVGWKGIRQRKVHLEQLLDQTIAQATQEFGEVRILDIAAGPGRYVQETIKRNSDTQITATLCDRDAGGLEEGMQISKSLGIGDRVEFKQSDAFDADSIRKAAGDKPVQIVIVSGLYELFPDNQPIEKSLAGIASVLCDGGWLIYTDQPWHPQQEMIAKVLPNRDGDPWVMRCRSQGEMDSLVREAGMHRERLLIDRWGIFSVAKARKV